MRITVFITFIFSSYFFSFPSLDSFAENSPIKRNGKLFYVHQYQLDVGFGRVNDYLCLFRNTDYKKFSNLGDGIGYEAILDNNACQNGEANLPWLVVSKQATSSDNLVMEMSSPNNVADPRIKLILEEETSATNPYGVLTLDYNYISMGNGVAPNPANGAGPGDINTPLYNATYESSILPNGQVQFLSTVYLDSIVLNNLIPVGQQINFYGSKILHTQGGVGRGTVTELAFNSGIGNYPDGTPSYITTTNFAYNAVVVKYEITSGSTGLKNIIFPDSASNAGLQSSDGQELCVSRTDSWEYVRPTSYGVYDSNGNRITFSTIDPAQAQTASYNFTSNNPLWDGKIKIFSGSWLGTGLQCKKIEDGSSLTGVDGLCPGTVVGDVTSIIRINGHDYQNFPLFDVPEGTVLTVDQTGEEYYVRQLGVSKVYSARPVGDPACATLTIEPSLDTPDHTFFNYPVVKTPRTGAVLVNKLNATTDLFSQSLGTYYPKDGDQDGDGIPNYLDAFPTDPLKYLDSDHDLVEDSEDNDTTVFQPDWTNHKHLNKTMYSNYFK